MIASSEILYLNPRAIEPNRENVRRDNGDLIGLAETIREHGVLQPIGVAPQNGGYRIVYGDRRREAAILIGLDRVPCIVLGQLDEGERLVRNILENLQRLDLNDMEKARAFDKMIETMRAAGLDRAAALDALTRRLGLSASQIKRYLGLLELAAGVQALVGAGEIGVTHAQHLRPIIPAARQEAVARLAADENISAAELSRLASALARNPNVDPTEALAALRRGDSVADLSLPVWDNAGRHLPPPPPAKAEEDETEDEGAALEGEEAEQRPPSAGTFTRDGNRVRKFHSLDSFMDEVDRLTRCVQDGDFAKLVAGDGDGSVKMTLLAKQLGFLARALTDMTG